MRLSVSYGGFGPVAPFVPAVAAAESAGLDGVWCAEHVGFHDAVVPCAWFLGRTARLEVGVVGPGPASRHPGLLAMELASLAEVGPGRVRVQVGLGDTTLIRRIGGHRAGALRQVDELVGALRRLLAGKRLDGTYCGYDFDGFQVAPVEPPVPVDVMAVRPRMLALAARVGDGVSLSSGASLGYLTQAVAAVERELDRQGRDRGSFRVTAMALGAVGATVQEAAAPVLAALPMFAPEALGVLAPEVPGAAEGALTVDVAARTAVVATPDSLPGVLAAYAATGIDELSVNLLNPLDELPDLLPLVAAARP